MIVVDSTAIIALGSHGHIDLLTAFDGIPGVPPAVQREVTDEPARAALDAALEAGIESLPAPEDEAVAAAQRILDERAVNGDVHVVALAHERAEADGAMAVVSDDRTVRRTVAALGGDVTGTLGTVTRAVAEGMLTPGEAKDLVRRVEGSELHMTASLRERAFEGIDEAARDDP